MNKKKKDEAACTMCSKTLQCPHQTKCCYQRFCENCIKPAKICPKCKGSVFYFYDKSFDQYLKQLTVYCPNQMCGKEIQYGDLKEHLNQCEYSEVQCRNEKCEVIVQRQHRIRHEQLECGAVPLLQRDKLKKVFNSELESIKSKVTNQLHQKDREIKEMREKIARCRESEENSSTVPVIRILRKFSRMKEKNKECMLEPFYTHENGYKVGICVVPNGYSEAKDTHVSLFTFLEKGENDDYLPWPFHGNITVQLLDHSSNFAHRQATIRYNDFHPGYSNRNHLGITFGGQGKYHLVSHASLSDDKHVQFLRDDCLHIRISEVERDITPQNKDMGWLLICVSLIILSTSIHLLFLCCN